MAFWASALAVFLADQLSKAWALSWLARYPGHRAPLVPGCFDLYLQFNTGGAFSLFHDRPWIIISFAVAAVIWMTWHIRRLPLERRAERFAFGLIVGGALGNLVDRFRLGYVVDFFHVYWREWYWPTFNVADSAICLGVGLYLLLTLRATSSPEHQPNSGEPPRESGHHSEDGEVTSPARQDR